MLPFSLVFVYVLPRYRNENVEMRVTMDDTKKASVLLIRKLFLLMQNLDVLPNDVSLTMRLYYYDDGDENYPYCVVKHSSAVINTCITK